MLIKHILKLAIVELEGFLSKELESRILLAHILGTTPEILLTKYDEEISKDDRLKYFEYISRRRSLEPVAYIIGKKEFYGIDFLVDNHVLIPRPDTETLVDAVIHEYQSHYKNQEVKILDLGTGSGAIAVSLACNIDLCKITATDFLQAPLKLARANAELNKVQDKIKFVKSNWYSNLEDEKFDFIISNPPYISINDKKYVANETLRYEPKEALFAEDDGLSNYHQIISNAHKFLKINGSLFLEIGFNQSKNVTSILEKHSFSKIRVLKDLSKINRVIIAQL